MRITQSCACLSEVARHASICCTSVDFGRQKLHRKRRLFQRLLRACQLRNGERLDFNSLGQIGNVKATMNGIAAEALGKEPEWMIPDPQIKGPMSQAKGRLTVSKSFVLSMKSCKDMSPARIW